MIKKFFFKICTSCGEEKSSTFFNKAKGGKYGVEGKCKKCRYVQMKEYDTEYRQRPETKALRSKSNKARYKRLKESNDPMYLKHLQFTKEWRENNPKRFREMNRKWRKTTLKGRTSRMNYRAKRRLAQHPNMLIQFTANDLAWIEDTYGKQCVYCGETESKLEWDHRIPLVAGGHHVRDNLVPCCKSCNSTKSSETWEVQYYRQEAL